jgi:hypothetical protein
LAYTILDKKDGAILVYGHPGHVGKKEACFWAVPIYIAAIPSAYTVPCNCGHNAKRRHHAHSKILGISDYKVSIGGNGKLLPLGQGAKQRRGSYPITETTAASSTCQRFSR